MISYVCNRCGFRFKRSESWIGKVCPFCGRENSFGEETSINELIEEVGKDEIIRRDNINRKGFRY